MRRKPDFDRFNAGLTKRVESVMKDSDYEIQDIVNMTRSECARNWKYLIEKLNKKEQELKDLQDKMNDEAYERCLRSQYE